MQKYCPYATANAIMDLNQRVRVNEYALIRHWMSNLEGNASWKVREVIRNFNDKRAEALLDRAMHYSREGSAWV
jgi:hypothetical protein